MIPIEQLLEAGVHFGHRVNKWNPKMAPYIFGERNGVHIIDLIQTLAYLEESYVFLSKYTSKTPANAAKGAPSGMVFADGIGSKVLFVGTKKQVSAIIQKEAENSYSNYVNHRWLGGLLTNWATIKLCIAKLKELRATGLFEEANLALPTLNKTSETSQMVSPSAVTFVATKKEKALLKKQYEKLKKFFGGIENMSELPEIVIIVGQDSEMNAVKECQKLATSWSAQSTNSRGGNSSKGKSLPRTITILDTNCDPSLSDLFIPANDDSTKSVELILTKLGEAIRLPR